MSPGQERFLPPEHCLFTIMLPKLAGAGRVWEEGAFSHFSKQEKQEERGGKRRPVSAEEINDL